MMLCFDGDRVLHRKVQYSQSTFIFKLVAHVWAVHRMPYDLMYIIKLLRCCCAVAALWFFSNNDIIFDFDRLNAIQVFLSYAFSNKRFYLMMLGFGGDRFLYWKVQYGK